MNLATLCTFSRILIAPFFAVFFITSYTQQKPGLLLGAVIAAVLIELSDMFDGMIARARHEVTDFGKVSDPVADVISRQTVFLSFLVTGIIPLWMILVFFYRESLQMLLRIVCASNGVALAARMTGKVKAVIQAVATFVVLGDVYCTMVDIGITPVRIAGKSIGYWAVFLAVVATAASFLDYIIPNRSSIMKMLERK